jgi:hypothetical protein
MIRPQEWRELRGAQGMREPGHWYVSYTVKSNDGVRRYARKTRTFATEELAKQFAKEMIDGNLCPSAGTINPHLPKRTISAAAMAAWLEAPTQPSPARAAAEPARSRERSSEV